MWVDGIDLQRAVAEWTANARKMAVGSVKHDS